MVPRITLAFVATFLVFQIAVEAHAEDTRDGLGEPLASGPTLHAAPRCGRLETSVRRSPWQLAVAPYGWLASARGEVWADGVKEDITVPVDESIEQTSFGYQLLAEVRYKRSFAFMDLTRAVLRDEHQGALLQIKSTVEQTIMELAVGHRILGPAFTSPRASRCASVDVFAGARLWLTDIDISLGLPVGAGSGSERDRWWDPFVGARLWTPIAGPVGLSLRADVGGFGIGEASDVAWQAWALVTWRMSRHWSLGVGYRVSYYDRITGSGPDKNGMDLFQYGPMVGIGFST